VRHHTISAKAWANLEWKQKTLKVAKLEIDTQTSDDSKKKQEVGGRGARIKPDAANQEGPSNGTTCLDSPRLKKARENTRKKNTK